MTKFANATALLKVVKGKGGCAEVQQSHCSELKRQLQLIIDKEKSNGYVEKQFQLHPGHNRL